jgi:hypothetical protein
MTTAHIWLKHCSDAEILKKMDHHTAEINRTVGTDAEEHHSNLLDILYAELIERHGLEEAISLYEQKR